MLVDVPGHGQVEFPDSMTREQVVAAIRTLTGADKREAAKTEEMRATDREIAGWSQPPGPAAPRVAASEMAGEMPVPGAEVAPSGPGASGEDVLTRMADSATFGLAPRVSASNIGRYISRVGQTPISDLVRGNIAPDPNAGLSKEELLAKRRAEVEEAGKRLGLPGAILADVGGGVLTGNVLGRLPALWKSAAPGATLLGRVKPTAGLLTKSGAGAAEGAAYGAASAAGHTDDPDKLLENTLEGAAIGGGTGGLLTGGAAVIPRVITPFPTTDPVRREAMETLRKAGVDVTAGTKTGDPKLRLAEDIIGKLPFGGKLTEEQMPQVTQAVMKKAGIGGGGAATPEVVGAGFDKVGGTINTLQKPHTLTVDNPMLNAVAKVESEIKPLVGDSHQKPLQHFIDRLTSKATIAPDEGQALRTQLNTAIKEATDPAHSRGLIALKEALDDNLQRTMAAAGDDAGIEALKVARNQYAHLHILTDALGLSGAAGNRGELTPSALSRAIQHSVGRTEFYKGAGDLNDLARASAGYLQPPRDSFTATREGYLNPLKWAAGAAGRAGLGNPVMQKYWGNQVMPTAPVSGAAVQPAVAGLAGPADRIMEGLLAP